MSIRVIVADDQEIVRTGLTMILSAQPDIEVVGVAADGHQAVRLALDYELSRALAMGAGWAFNLAVAEWILRKTARGGAAGAVIDRRA